jgi:hypothetical protein
MSISIANDDDVGIGINQSINQYRTGLSQFSVLSHGNGNGKEDTVGR